MVYARYAADAAGVVEPPSDPQMWMDYLASKLASQMGKYRRFSDYYEGRHQRMLFSQASQRSQFSYIFENFSDNFCALTIDAVNERMMIEGFRLSEDSGKDELAREIWQRNHMDAESSVAHRDAMIQGASYAVVWGSDEKSAGTRATISVESSENVVVQYKPGSRKVIEAAAKFYTDDWGRQYSTLWWGDRVYIGDWKINGYSIDRDEPNPLKRPPVVPIQNRSRLTGDPVSDIAIVIPIQDAVNKIVSDSLTTSECAAFPQKFVTGIEIHEDSDGRPIEPFRIAVDKLLQAEDPAASFGQFAAADLSNYVSLIDMLVQHLAAISRIPFHYLMRSGQPPSGDAITSAEAGLVSKCREKMLHFGEAWEDIIRLCIEVEKGSVPDEYAMAEVVWADAEHRTESQHVDALLKLKMLDVPKQQLWADAGYTPQQIARFEDMLEEEAKTAMERAEKYQLPGAMPGQQPGQQPGGQNPAKVAAKPPQGNSGNENRQRFEQKKR